MSSPADDRALLHVDPHAGKLERFAGKIGASFASAFFLSLERCSCITLHTADDDVRTHEEDDADADDEQQALAKAAACDAGMKGLVNASEYHDASSRPSFNGEEVHTEDDSRGKRTEKKGRFCFPVRRRMSKKKMMKLKKEKLTWSRSVGSAIACNKKKASDSSTYTSRLHYQSSGWTHKIVLSKQHPIHALERLM